MVMMFPVGAALIAALLRANYHQQRLHLPALRLVSSVFLITALQQLLLRMPNLGAAFTALLPPPLFSAHLALLPFAIVNRRHPGFPLLGIGLALNLLVMGGNGGYMPVSPETLTALTPAVPIAIPSGYPIEGTKDVLLPGEATQFGWLSDWLLLPPLGPYRVAFSIGDLVIAIGACRFLWSLGAPARPPHTGGLTSLHGFPPTSILPIPFQRVESFVSRRRRQQNLS